MLYSIRDTKSSQGIGIRLSLLAMTAVIGIASLLPYSRSKADSASCLTTPGTASVNSQIIDTAYQSWKNSYVTASGADGALRVQRSDDDNYDTVSEGIGYGMLFAAYNHDQATFNGLWQYEQAHLDADGLMNWRITAAGTTNGFNAATDADEDMAMALVTADKTWGGYQTAALHQINLIKQYEVEVGSDVLKPGDVWGGSNLLNPSYLSPAYYQVFATYTGDTSWNTVASASYTVLYNIRDNTASNQTGLVPDWSTANGSPVSGMSYNYSYDASRDPIRLAIAADWYCDSNATRLLAPFNATFESIPTNKIATSYNLDGSVAAVDGSNVTLLSSAVAGASVGSNQTYSNSEFDALVNSPAAGYFPDSLRLFSLMVATGAFNDPLQTPVTTAAVPLPMAAAANPATVTPASSQQTDPATVSTTANTITKQIAIWWPTGGSRVSGVQPFKAVLDGSNVDDYQMYWQVDGGSLNLMTSNMTDYAHKEAAVNITGWNWHGSGPYDITFVAKNPAGSTIASASTNINITK
jgi:endo-1,4-beta-D-glucanase Y